ncbi:MAG: hypothetical protein KA314_06495 [Chloroflexi bacterium]|nr:hypothetical protein [Chloroflexota bacterium]MBP8055473.1 hypothetical protein [Chloroflexota bacterium]
MLHLTPRQQTLLHVSLTAILAAYWLVWMPGPGAGLQLIGLEMGEWVKFLPEVRAGQISAGRDLFYLPPITAGLLLALSTVGWPHRWPTWLVRGLAVLVSLLAFPSLDAIRFEPRSEWLWRLGLVGLVVMGVGVTPWLNGRRGKAAAAFTILLSLIAIAGAVLPVWAYLVMRPAISHALTRPVGFGPGFWLNMGGHGVAAAVLLASLVYTREPREVSPNS